MAIPRRSFLGLAALLVGGRAWAFDPKRVSLEALGQRFHALKAERDAAPNELSRWGGELHQVMTELGRRLGIAGTKGARVVEIMGEPDAHRDGRWVYFWRGWHDYLYFEVARAAVVRADWYFAYE